MISPMSISTIALILLLLLLLLNIHFTTAAHARKRPTVTIRSSANTYDRQITTFDPNGHLLQVEYAHECTKRGNSCLFVNYNNVIIAIIKKKQNVDDTNNILMKSESGGMHRISDGILSKMTGLEGDGRLMAKHLQNVSHKLAWTEGIVTSSTVSLKSEGGRVVYVDQIARICGEVLHSLTIRPGARTLGVDAVFMGKISTDALGLFQCSVGGTVNQCEFCVSGKDSSLLLGQLNSFMDQIKNNLENKSNEGDSGEINEENINSNRERISSSLYRLITGLSSLVLHPMKGLHDKKSAGLIKQDDDKCDSVDIYVITLDSKCRGGIRITNAISVGEQELDDVAKMFQSNVMDSEASM